MECPICGQELSYRDSYGKHNWEMGPGVTGMRDSWDFEGDLYKCINEECDGYEERYHTDRKGNLKKDWPV